MASVPRSFKFIVGSNMTVLLAQEHDVAKQVTMRLSVHHGVLELLDT